MVQELSFRLPFAPSESVFPKDVTFSYPVVQLQPSMFDHPDTHTVQYSTVLHFSVRLIVNMVCTISLFHEKKKKT